VRRLPLTLDQELYQRLLEQAQREERDPVQQARVILRRVLEPGADDARDKDGNG
jgi:hypothetical protein